ncbi:B3 domain-containing protein REM17-like isoform X3 [Lycium barbarum]|uniref:B3 domain-containing protein REM17-like isoform X3 n=1 Tax=Lycium barbarum TaxID=112863 RepID=UPI00293E3F78|nr:B3 domain-containing protein REM17-like isoform X3 [Lycium barbarum]
MEIRPKKPHFFKPILPGFKNSLKIPVGFLKYLKGHDQHEHAILKRAGKKWLVKLNDHRFEEGWGKFAEEFDLQLRDILVFRHEGDMEFEVSIFDSSHCDREYAEYMQEEKNNNVDRKCAEYLQIEEEDWDEDEEEDEEKGEEAAAHDKPFGQSHFECTIRPYCLSKGFLCLPRNFVFANGLTNKKCCLIVRDERQRSWNLRITSNKTQVCIGDGWRKFIADNCLKEGDRIKFEVVTDGETPIWKFQVVSEAEAPLQKFQVTDLRTSSVTTPNSQVAASTSAHGNPRLSHCNTEHAEYLQEEDEEEEEDEFEEDEYKEKEEDEEEEDGEKGEEGAIHDKPFGQSHFECTVRPYCLSKGFLCLPKHFVFANGLTDKKCALIIRDERQRSWNLRIISSKTQVCIGDGWRKFVADNCLKEGDRIKFEVVTNGEAPIWKFHVVTDAETPLQKFHDPRLKTSNVTTPNSQVAASTSADANPHLSHCNTEYAEYLQEEEEDEEVEEDEFDMEDEYEEEEDKEKGEEVATHNKPFGQSHFECTIRPYCLSKSFLCLPKPFVFANGLTNIKCGLVIRDERQRSWNLRIISSKSQVLIGDGWRKFIADNHLKEGDRIKFEVVTDGETPIWKFQVVTDAKTPLQKFLGQSHFECTIGRYCLSRGYLFLPQQFAIANGLINKNWLIVRDKRKRSWKLKLSHSNNPRPRVYIGGGWSKFIAENCLKEGGRIMFEVVTNGETPIWKLHVVTIGETPMKKFQEKPRPSIKLSDETSSHAEAATNEPYVQSYFECTIRQYCLSRGLLYLPQQFAFANGLIDKNCDLIIRDERQRSWNLKLRYWEPIVYITDEWRKFIADNCLKEGDRIKFEVVTNGETPIWKFQVVSEAETPLQKFQDIMKMPSNVGPLEAQGSTSASVDDDHPFFISTIKPYCISKTEFCLPTDFVKSNGLINRKCEMILQDEAQRCWSVWLGRIGNRFGITRGWTVFRAANGLQIGDAYKFELIKNGEVPIAHFHCRYSKKVAKRKKR